MTPPTSLNNGKRGAPSIGWFVVLSLLLHALLFWGVVQHQTVAPMPTPQQATNGFRISLKPYRVPVQPREARQQPSQTAANKKRNSVPQAVAAANATAAQQNSEANFRERIVAKLRRALTAHFSYPLLARQRNWQGEVLLAFRLERDGRISEARIARSSGYNLLDHAALSALDRVEQLGEMLPRSLSIELPVIYRLEG